MSTLKHLRSSTADKRPTASGMADGQIAINTASGTPGLYIRDTASGIVKVGPAHVGTTAPNATPAGSAGNSRGEFWIDEATTTPGLKYWNGSAFTNLTPSGTTTTVGLVELATNAETQDGSDALRAVTPAGLQSKVSDSISTTSSTTIASATAVKTAYDVANAALPRAGGTVTGQLLISPSGSLVFEGSSDDSFETTFEVVNPTADRTITFPDVTGTVITSADTGTVTSAMIANGAITNDDINASAAIALSKLATGALPTAITVASANIVDGTIVDADVNASAAIAGTKISPNFGSQNTTTTGTSTAASFIPTSSTAPTNGLYLSGTNTVALATASTGRLFVDASGRVGIGAAPAVNLDVYGSNLAGRFISTTGTSCFIRFDGTGASTPFVGILGGIGVFGNTDASPIAFNTNGLERMRLTSDGRLGVGTSAPGTPLSISHPSNAFIEVTNSTAAKSNYVGTNSSGDLDLNGSGSQNILLKTAGNERLRVDSSGRVGIGTASPGHILDCSSSVNTDAAVRITNASTGTGAIAEFLASNGTSTAWFGIGGTNYTPYAQIRAGGAAIYTGSAAGIGLSADNANGYISFGTGAGAHERARLTSDGRLGLGTSGPSDRLTIQNTSGGAGIGLLGSGNAYLSMDAGVGATAGNQVSYIDFKLNGTLGANFALNEGTSGSPLEINSAVANNVVLVTGGGKVGIGTTSPGEALAVSGKLWVADDFAEPASTSDRGDITITNATGPADLLFLDRGLAATRIGVDTNDSGNFKFVTDREFVFRRGGTSYSAFNTGSESCRIDSSGRLLVGTSTSISEQFSGQARIQTAGTNYYGIASFQYSNDIVENVLTIAKSRGTSVGSHVVVQSGDNLGMIRFQGSDGTGFIQAASITASVDGTPGTNDMPGRLIFSTTADGASSPTERMRIQQNGTVLIGTTSTISIGSGTTDGVQIEPTALAISRDGQPVGYFRRRSSDGQLFQFYRDTTQVGNISVTTTSTSFVTSSDYRLKENVVPLTGAIDRLSQLQVHRFNFIADPDKTVDGFIAHEAQAVVPECVTGTKDEVDEEGNAMYQGIDQSKLVPLVVAALQEALAEIETLKTKVAALEAK
jgi:hypothetical protein